MNLSSLCYVSQDVSKTGYSKAFDLLESLGLVGIFGTQAKEHPMKKPKEYAERNLESG